MKKGMTLKRMTAVVVSLALAATALAQDTQRPGDRGRRGAGRGRGPSLSRIVDRLNRELNLDEEQLAKIQEIVAAHESDQQDVAAKWQEVREAMQAGNEERANELREQLREQQGGAVEAVLDEIEPLLHEDQMEAFQDVRERMAQRRGPGGPGDMFRIMRELPDAVNMTEEQRKEYDALLQERRAGMRERMMERRQQQEGEGVGPDRRGDRPGFEAMFEGFFEDVAKILNEDQVKLLDEYRARIESERGASGSRESDDIRLILSAVKRVRDLSDEQKDTVRDIEREATRASRELRRDREGLALLAAQVKADIIKLLDEQQAKEFQENLDRMQARGQRAERGRRGRSDREASDSDRPEKP